MVHKALDHLAPACPSTSVPSRPPILQYRVKKGHSLLLHKLTSFPVFLFPHPVLSTWNSPSLKGNKRTHASNKALVKCPFSDSSSLSFMRAESSV